MSGVGIIFGTSTLLGGLGVAEALQHRRKLRSIPIRIHVNGTRGKSSVTRMIAAGLRAGGIRTAAKTTGTLARMIMPDGREYPVFRPSRPNVIEQLRIVRTAAELGVEALVIECMAVQPRLQSLSEQRFVRSNFGVITNARPDHLDVMGPTEEDVAFALAGTTPVGGTLFIADTRHQAIFASAAEDRRSQLVSLGAEEVAAVSAAELSGFLYLEHAENLALALKVCAHLGVDRATALGGMWAAQPDPGVLTAHELSFFGRRLIFLNAFAANDPDSTARIFRRVLAQFADVERRVVVVNCRADRPYRSEQLGQACASFGPVDHYVLIGDGTYTFARSAVRAGVDPGQMTHAEGLRVDEIFEVLVELCGASALLIGIANIGGPGLDLSRYFRNRGRRLLPA